MVRLPVVRLVAQAELPPYLREPPKIVNAVLEQDDWSLPGETEVAPRG